MRYLIKGSKWKFTDKIRNTTYDNVIEIRKGELIILFNRGNMQVFTMHKELKKLDFEFVENNYQFKGQIMGKVDDIFVYKRNQKDS